MTIYKKQFSMLAAVLVLLFSTMMVPAWADRPAEFSFPPAVFYADDPCTGEETEFTFFYDAFEHQGHKKNLVGRSVVASGFTDTGYEAFTGHTHFVLNENVFVSNWKDMWRHADGRMFFTSGVFVLNFNQGEVKVFIDELRCIGQ